MEYTTLGLSTKFPHRYKVSAKLLNIHNKELVDVILFLDLGCYNTLIPKRLAIRSGTPLPYKRLYAIGGKMVETQAYSIEKLKLGDVVLERVIAFAGDYTGEFARDILIGTNVMNNWKMLIDRKANIFQFAENPPDNIANKKYIYQNYFDLMGNYIYIQDEEIEK